MQLSKFNAVSPFEIGDRITDVLTGRTHVITDIACIHYCKSGKVEFRYRLDENAEYVPLSAPIKKVSFSVEFE